MGKWITIWFAWFNMGLTLAVSTLSRRHLHFRGVGRRGINGFWSTILSQIPCIPIPDLIMRGPL